jgi:hypothetical protein
MIKIDEEIEPGMNMLAIREVRPAMPLDVAGAEAIGEVALSDTGKDSFAGRQLDRVEGAINAPGMALQISGEGKRLEQGWERDSALPFVGEVGDESEGGDQLSIFRKMTLKRRGQLATS